MTHDRDDGQLTTTGRYAEAPIGAERPVRHGVNWRFLLLVFMRITACVWLLKGLLNWAFIIGFAGSDFSSLRLSRQGIIIAFAVLDVIAAVGLWLASSWGAAVWLLVLAIEALLPLIVPDLGRSWGDTLLAMLFGGAYLFLLWQITHEAEDR